jgi:hypothetical protein
MRKASEKPLLALIETSITNGDPTVPLAATSVLPVDEDTSLSKAIATVKAAGYRIARAKASKIPRPKKRVGPTFQAEFSDGVVTRMSVFCSLEKLDWDRGERLSIAAWQSRWRSQHPRPQARDWWKGKLNRGQREAWASARIFENNSVAPVPPAIVAAHFEQDGVVLARRPDNEAAS